MDNDQYGSVLREAMKKSMEEPFKPLNRKIERITPKLIIERRRKWLRRWWWHACEMLDVILLAILIVMASLVAILTYGLLPR